MKLNLVKLDNIKNKRRIQKFNLYENFIILFLCYSCFNLFLFDRNNYNHIKDSVQSFQVVNGYKIDAPIDEFRITPGVSITSEEYWESRYLEGNNSGAGSYGRLSIFKAEIINKFIITYNVSNVIEFGCGDGNQLKLMEYPSYLGIDVSKTVLEHCRKIFSHDITKKFLYSDEYSNEKAELVISLDVIYHLIEDDVFEMYMRRLFNAAEIYVIIYSSNMVEKDDGWHVRHRKFTEWIENNIKGWFLSGFLENKYKEDSSADFYVYEKTIAYDNINTEL